MQLTFPHEQVAELLKEAEERWPQEVRRRYGIEDPAGFWLVGDEGVYLMHNGKATEGARQRVVYANECNPETTEDWWHVKRASFGGDDGVEFIPAQFVRDAVKAGSAITVELTPEKMLLSFQKAA